MIPEDIRLRVEWAREEGIGVAYEAALRAALESLR
jgi:hypothetical protein